MNKRGMDACLGLLVLGLAAPLAAKVAPDEAAKQGQSLTPVGAEKAGNSARKVPAWQPEPQRGPLSGEFPNNPKIDAEKPLFTITKGRQKLLSSDDSYKMNIFPDMLRQPLRGHGRPLVLRPGGHDQRRARTLRLEPGRQVGNLHPVQRQQDGQQQAQIQGPGQAQALQPGYSSLRAAPRLDYRGQHPSRHQPHFQEERVLPPRGRLEHPGGGRLRQPRRALPVPARAPEFSPTTSWPARRFRK